MKWNSNNRILGLTIALLAPIVILYGINVYNFPSIGFDTFLSNAWNFRTLTNWLKIAVLFNLVFFMLFINLNKLKSAQGIVFGTIIYGLLIVYLTFS